MLRVDPTAVQLSGTASGVECLRVGLTDTVCIGCRIPGQVVSIVHWAVAHVCSVLLVDGGSAHRIVAENCGASGGAARRAGPLFSEPPARIRECTSPGAGLVVGEESSERSV